MYATHSTRHHAQFQAGPPPPPRLAPAKEGRQLKRQWNGGHAVLLAAVAIVAAMIPGTASAAQSPSAQAARGPAARLAAADAGPVTCHAYTVPVALAPGQPASSSVWGEL